MTKPKVCALHLIEFLFNTWYFTEVVVTLIMYKIIVFALVAHIFLDASISIFPKVLGIIQNFSFDVYSGKMLIKAYTDRVDIDHAGP